jgi:hypothetical protein
LPLSEAWAEASAVFVCAPLRGGTRNTRDHKPSRLREILIANFAKTCLL